MVPQSTEVYRKTLEVKQRAPLADKTTAPTHSEFCRLRLPFVILVALWIGFAIPNGKAQQVSADDIARPVFGRGEEFGNIFSKTTSYQGAGIDDQSRSVAGSTLYRVLDPSPTHLVFHGSYRYDGKSSGEGDAEVRDGGAQICNTSNHKCASNRDSSGPIYNFFLWGTPKRLLKSGTHWTISIHEPWELGPAGSETVTVLQVDKPNHEVILKREGTGNGLFDAESAEITLKKNGKPCTFEMVPGTTHWIGTGVFRRGVTISDELLETRELRVNSKDCGDAIVEERQFTLLVKAPSELL